jgi:DNA topoisomerase VI subunit A
LNKTEKTPEMLEYERQMGLTLTEREQIIFHTAYNLGRIDMSYETEQRTTAQIDALGWAIDDMRRREKSALARADDAVAKVTGTVEKYQASAQLWKQRADVLEALLGRVEQE